MTHILKTRFFWLVFFMPLATASATMVTVHPEETPELLANPGIGWETFHHTRLQDKHLPPWVPSTVQYTRWRWGELEKTPGVLNTELIDKTLHESHEAGQKLAFRVMCCSPYKKPYHPAWLKKIGGRVYDVDFLGTGTYPIPDMNNPVVLKAHLDFIRRLGERYDGHPDLDHVDLGSIGWWGEWHLSGSKTAIPTTGETGTNVVNAYLAAFKKTPLVMLLNGKQCAGYAIAHGTGWRVDSMGDLGSFSPKWCHMRNAYPLWHAIAQADNAWKTAPIAYEPPRGMNEFSEKHWPLRWIFNYALACHGSLFNGKSGVLPEDPLFKSELERFLARLGYRFVLHELRHPSEAKAGGMLPLTMKWQNIGSAPCYRPYRLAYRLTGANGYQKTIGSAVTVNRWMPGSIKLFDDAFFKEPKDLPPGEIANVPDTLKLPADLPVGRYAFAIGIVDETMKPIVRLAIKGRDADGWYALSNLTVTH